MVAILGLALSFAIGITCSLMACCVGLYLGLFAYLQTNGERPSRIKAGLMSFSFSVGVIIVVAALGAGFLLLQLELMSVMTGNGMLVIDIIGFAILSVLGASYLLGKSLSIPLPYVGPPSALTNMKGYRAAPLYGAFFGGPGAAHCTIMLVIPVIFLSLSSLDPLTIVWNFSFYAAGRVIPIVAIGMMLQDAQVRFMKIVAARSGIINRLIGVAMVLSGVSLFFIR